LKINRCPPFTCLRLLARHTLNDEFIIFAHSTKCIELITPSIFVLYGHYRFIHKKYYLHSFFCTNHI
jgi:hypothetical protein